MTRSSSTRHVPDRALSLAAGLSIGVFLLAACHVFEGPIEYGGDGAGTGSVCTPGAVEESILFGDTLRSNGAITIDDVELVGAQGLHLVHAWLLPPGSGGIGAAKYPALDVAGWRHRRLAEGALVQPGEWVHLVVQVARDSDAAGSADFVAIRYTSGGIHFRKPGSLSIEVRESCV